MVNCSDEEKEFTHQLLALKSKVFVNHSHKGRPSNQFLQAQQGGDSDAKSIAI